MVSAWVKHSHTQELCLGPTLPCLQEPNWLHPGLLEPLHHYTQIQHRKYIAASHNTRPANYKLLRNEQVAVCLYLCKVPTYSDRRCLCSLPRVPFPMPPARAHRGSAQTPQAVKTSLSSPGTFVSLVGATVSRYVMPRSDHPYQLDLSDVCLLLQRKFWILSRRWKNLPI